MRNDKLIDSDKIQALGEFDVCTSCALKLRAGNDLFTILNPRISTGKCYFCGKERVLRRVATDNLMKAARFTVKRAEVYPIRKIVKIVGAPKRYESVIGETAEIIGKNMTRMGPRYKLMLGDGHIIPVYFKHNDLEPID